MHIPQALSLDQNNVTLCLTDLDFFVFMLCCVVCFVCLFVCFFVDVYFIPSFFLFVCVCLFVGSSVGVDFVFVCVCLLA